MKNSLKLFSLLIVFSFFVFSTACSTDVTTPAPTQPALVSTEIAAAPAPETQETYTALVNSYNLGDTTILQDHFPEDSQFRNMPVRLEGVIGVPESDAAHPVVLILHGSHEICGGEDIWPCPEEVEQKNYEGFTYLVEDLAEAGYVALAINVNAEHTFGFGEAPPPLRTTQLIDMHLGELAAANAGESDKFGVDVNGRADLSHMVWLGHSRGGDFANWIVREQNLVETTSPVGYGPVTGILFVAPATMFVDALPMVDVPFSVILPACDTDIASLAGQGFYESARFNSERENWGTTVYMEGAEHNRFNTVLPPNSIPDNRPDCVEESLITAVAQQDFLSQYTLDFLQMLYGHPEQASMAQERLGMDANHPVPTTFHDAAVRFNTLPATENQLSLMQPQSDTELSENLLGGEVTPTGIEAVFCPEGYYVPNMEPGTEPCQRVNFNQPGYPQQFVISWEETEAELRIEVPATEQDWHEKTAVQLRAAVEPLSDFNTEGEPQALSIVLADGSGGTAQASISDIPFPIGEEQANDFFDGSFFTGHVHMSSYRVPLAAFEGVDLANINEVILRFDQTSSGTLFAADLEIIGNK